MSNDHGNIHDHASATPTAVSISDSNHLPDPEKPDLGSEPKNFEDDLPDGGYGWVVVGCCFLLNFVGFGIGNA